MEGNQCAKCGRQALANSFLCHICKSSEDITSKLDMPKVAIPRDMFFLGDLNYDVLIPRDKNKYAIGVKDYDSRKVTSTATGNSKMFPKSHYSLTSKLYDLNAARTAVTSTAQNNSYVFLNYFNSNKGVDYTKVIPMNKYSSPAMTAYLASKGIYSSKDSYDSKSYSKNGSKESSSTKGSNGSKGSNSGSSTSTGSSATSSK